TGGEPPCQADRHGHREHNGRHHVVTGRRAQHHGADQHRKLAYHLVHGVHEQHARAEPVPLDLRLGHVASSAPIAAISVSRATTASPTCEPGATRRPAPADDAVVTVTFARPNMRSSGPRCVSTVCTRDIGAIRRSCTSQPVLVYTACGSMSHRCTRY